MMKGYVTRKFPLPSVTPTSRNSLLQGNYRYQVFLCCSRSILDIHKHVCICTHTYASSYLALVVGQNVLCFFINNKSWKAFNVSIYSSASFFLITIQHPIVPSQCTFSSSQSLAITKNATVNQRNFRIVLSSSFFFNPTGILSGLALKFIDLIWAKETPLYLGLPNQSMYNDFPFSQKEKKLCPLVSFDSFCQYRSRTFAQIFFPEFQFPLLVLLF